MDHLALLILLCMDDGALLFYSRKDAIIGSQICIEAMAKFRPIVHAGKIDKESKTKAMLFPSTKTLKCQRFNKSSTLCVTDTSPPGSCDTVASMDCDKVDLHKLYIDAPKTKVININTDEHMPFVSSFCCLGSEIDFLLDDTSEIRIRINKANKAIGALKFIWNAKYVALESKIIFLAIPVNLALWNGKT